MEYQEPYEDQNLGGDHPIGVVAPMDGQTQVWSVAPQAPVCCQILCYSYLAEIQLKQDQENVGYAPLPEAVGPLQVQIGAEPDQAQVLDIPVPERLRRLAGRYVNNPESLVNGVHLESGPSGRFQIVITVEIGDILGDTID